MKYLFVDDYNIERADNLARKLHQPKKHGAVLRPEHRWENIGTNLNNAPIWDAAKQVYKLVYGCAAEPVDWTTDDLFMAGVTGPRRIQSYFCYAESADGVTWEKPTLKLYDYQGTSWDGKPISGENNIIPGGKPAVLDPNDPDPSRRYKAQRHADSTHLQTEKFAVSPDLFNWEWLDVPGVPQGGTSSLTCDEENGLFIITVKRRGPYGRSVYLTTSTDFESWTEPELTFHADHQDQENGFERIARFFDDPAYVSPLANRPEEYKTDVYFLPVFPYEGQYIGMPVLFHQSGMRAPKYENADGRKSIELVCSRDLRNWARVAGRKPFIELSPFGDGSAYDTGELGPANRPIVRNDELWFYYGGYRYRNASQAQTYARDYLNSSAIYLAKLRLDGFCSLKGGVEPGSVLTRPLEVDGDQLRINVDSWRGRVAAELLDPSEERPIPGYSMEESVPAVADRIDEPLRWKRKTDVSQLRGKTVQVRFSLLCAELYAFWFAD
jgi:hypothetical protein